MTEFGRLWVTRTEPGRPRLGSFSFKEYLRIVLSEEGKHRLCADRDLTSLEKWN
ncbi:MAG TPA: hypothetical protein VM347_03045 [Nonomuraea sp.]|nr:hypothetical protein [Nonomuraea sp.]